MRFFIALSALVLVLGAPALAADVVPVSVVVPYGEWVGAVSPYASNILFAIAIFGLRNLPAHLSAIATMVQAENLISMAISYGRNAVEGAARDKTLSIEVANPVLREAVAYALKYGPPWLLSHLGDPVALTEIVFARMHLAPEASKPDFDAIAAAAVKKAAA